MRPTPAPLPAADAQVDSPTVTPATAVPPPPEAPVEVLVSSTEVTSPWPRLRARYAMPGCNYSPAVQRFAKAMATSPRHLSAALRQAMPFVLATTAQIEKYDMPGEFAFLPWVESSYTMIPPNGDAAAGMWQLMPLTARELGLRIDADYDGRLDVIASTQTALVLIKQYDEEFGDWRLANMAFNAGVNGVRQAVANKGAKTLAAGGHPYLNQTNDEHLTKLLAMACIVGNPQRFAVSLPEPTVDDVPVLLNLPAPVDLRLAARAGGVDLGLMQRWNPAYLRGHMPDAGPFHLLVPSPRRAAIEATLGRLPQYAWRDWRDMRLQQPQNIDMLAMAYDVDPQALAKINRVDVNALLPAGKRLLLPGRDAPAAADFVVAVQAPAPASTGGALAAGDADSRCTVHEGDTLWNIARRYRVRVDDLLQWNRLSKSSTLRLGQQILLRAPAQAVSTASN